MFSKAIFAELLQHTIHLSPVEQALLQKSHPIILKALKLKNGQGLVYQTDRYHCVKMETSTARSCASRCMLLGGMSEGR